jgi:hypothetical protein
MKAKHIKMQISRKINDWLESIDDKPLQELLRPNIIVTGGCIVSMLLGQEPNDFDIYLRTKEVTKKLAEYYVKKFQANPPQRFKGQSDQVVKITVIDKNDRIMVVVKSSGIGGEGGNENYQFFEQVPGDVDQTEFIENVTEDAKETQKADHDKKSKYRPMFLTTNAITLSHKLQVVLRFWGEPEKIHKTYDFVHCTCYWDSGTKELVLPGAALESILTKDLRYMSQSLYPVCALVRVRKFLKRDWHINAGQLLKIAWDINRLDLSEIDVLEDQLVGVDTAYFLQLISALREKNSKEVDATYLGELVDKLF